jgi:flagellar hook-associated protein 2
MASTLGPMFTAGGLASGLNTNAIVEGLTAIASRPITDLQGKQAGLKTQISLLGDIASRLASLQDAAAALGTNGALAVTTSSSNTSFSATPSSGALAGSYQVEVTKLAAAAQSRSQAFASPTAPVAGGTLTLNVQGTSYAITISDGAALSDVALAIRQSGAPVSATVLNDGTNSYLSLTNRNTGYPIGGVAGDALSVTETTTGSGGQALAIASVRTAVNAEFTVDGLAFKRMSNTVTDAIPGTTLTLKSLSGGAPETLLLDTDVAGTKANLQKFVSAYNRAMELVQGQLNVAARSDRSATLAGDPTIRGLQRDLVAAISLQVGSGVVAGLVDLGIKTERDGSLSIDGDRLAAAMAQDPSAVNRIVQDASTGLGATVKALVTRYTDSATGLLTTNSKQMTDNITRMDDEIGAIQRRVDTYQEMLIRQFAAMETMVSNMKTIGNFLTAQQANSDK